MIGQDELDRFKAQHAALQGDELDKFQAQHAALQGNTSSSEPANSDNTWNRPHELLPKEELPPKVQDSLKRLLPSHVSEVSAAVGQPGGSFCMQYEADSGFAANFAS